MKWVILAVGKLRSGYAADGVRDFAGRIARMRPVEMVEVAAAKGGKGKAAGARAQAHESQNLLARIRRGDHVILLDERGDLMSSEALAQRLGELDQRVPTRVVFLIGGAFGVGEPVRERADEMLSLGPLTLPHEMARLILAEQLYRVLTIQRNSPYHHG